MKQLLNAALVFATTKHDGQYDKSGQPYVLHILKVFHYVKTDDEELNCIALLHDVIEDTDATFQDLYDIGMTKRIVDGVMLLTKMKGQTYEEYVAGVLSSRDAMTVKKADLRHNMDIRRLKGVSEKDMARMARYATFYQKIEEQLKDYI